MKQKIKPKDLNIKSKKLFTYNLRIADYADLKANSLTTSLTTIPTTVTTTGVFIK